MIGIPYLSKYAPGEWTMGGHPPNIDAQVIAEIGRCNCTWPHIEHMLALLLGVIMKGDARATVAVFTTLKNSGVQRDALEAAAEVMLPQSDVVLLRGLLDAHKIVEGKRNLITHGLWGYINNAEGIAVLIRAKEYAQFNVEALKTSQTARIAQFRELEKKMTVVSVKDLQTIHEAMVEDLKRIHLFLAYITRAPDGNPAPAQVLAELMQSSDLQDALNSTKAGKELLKKRRDVIA